MLVPVATPRTGVVSVTLDLIAVTPVLPIVTSPVIAVSVATFELLPTSRCALVSVPPAVEAYSSVKFALIFVRESSVKHLSS